jgi:hypothetical protein
VTTEKLFSAILVMNEITGVFWSGNEHQFFDIMPLSAAEQPW